MLTLTMQLSVEPSKSLSDHEFIRCQLPLLREAVGTDTGREGRLRSRGPVGQSRD